MPELPDMTVDDMLLDWITEEQVRLAKLQANVKQEPHEYMRQLHERAIEAHTFRLGVLARVQEGKL